jgi:Xaa-Pro aminopeptidase
VMAALRSIAGVRKGDKLHEVRSRMADDKVSALIIPTGDPHMSEYTAPCFGRREFISGFTGSAGTAVISSDVAALFTDGRYHSQAEKELDVNHWALMRVGTSGVPSPAEYLATTLPAGSVVGVDATVHSAEAYRKLASELQAKGVCVKNLAVHPVDAVWGADRPSLPTGKVREHPLEYAGKSTQEKINEVRQIMKQNGAEALVVTMLDEIAWLFNIRGCDVECNPVALSYALLTTGELCVFSVMCS